MKWKNIVNKPDLKVFESQDIENKIRIEARRDDDQWHIIEKSLSDPSKYIQEYMIQNSDFEEFMAQIMKKVSKPSKQANVKLYRMFKDNFVEKWLISVNKEKYSNFVIIQYDDLTSLDIVLHMKYKPIEKKIVFEIVSSLGINDDDLEYNVYYYSYSNKYFDLKYFEDYNDEE